MEQNKEQITRQKNRIWNRVLKELSSKGKKNNREQNLFHKTMVQKSNIYYSKIYHTGNLKRINNFLQNDKKWDVHSI